MSDDPAWIARLAQARALHQRLRRPGTGDICDAAELDAAIDGRTAAFTATRFDDLEGGVTTSIVTVDLGDGRLQQRSPTGRRCRLPRHAPSGEHLAWLEERDTAGNYQVHVETMTGEAITVPTIDGFVEALHWSPDGRRLLILAAGHGADVPATQGAVTSSRYADSNEAWRPHVVDGPAPWQWRFACIFELATGRCDPLEVLGVNIWEASWCGADDIVLLGSDGPEETRWYRSSLYLYSLADRSSRELFEPPDQLAGPAGAPDGAAIAVIAGVASDRGIVAGDVLLLDRGKSQRTIDTQGVDVTTLWWRDHRRLVLAGVRTDQSVVAEIDIATGQMTLLWQSVDLSTGGYPIAFAAWGEAGLALIAEGFFEPPAIVSIVAGAAETVARFGADPAAGAAATEKFEVERLAWRAPDGLTIRGYLLTPPGDAARPVVMDVHGGPVWHWRPRWLGRSNVPMLLLLAAGVSIFLPNPRGSWGGGQGYVWPVLGDMGGRDAEDLLAGLDHLVERGYADPDRLGVMGLSYGGFMTAWLTTQSERFAAGVAIAPFVNNVSQRLLSNIADFTRLFVREDALDGPAHHTRSPIFAAAQGRGAVLTICGSRDRCTPPAEAWQLHAALRAANRTSRLVEYPGEGHGVRQYPAVIDFGARVADWFYRHLGVVGAPR